MAHITASNLNVEFPISGMSKSLLTSVARSVGGILRRGGANGSGPVYVKALDQIALDLKNGDRVGLIGHNGAGKSTLLQTLNGGITPTTGTLTIEGKISPLLNMGNGAAGDFSGFENITLLGLHAGMSRAEIVERRDEIVAFSELGDFIHLPIRTYSAGMYLRLSFAIATAGTPEILLIDELFGAGDAAFYQKARKRMTELIERSGILVFSTHAISLIEMYCNKAIVLSKGKIVMEGTPAEAAAFYRNSNK